MFFPLALAAGTATGQLRITPVGFAVAVASGAFAAGRPNDQTEGRFGGQSSCFGAFRHHFGCPPVDLHDQVADTHRG